jgi:hypothetical protein
MNAAQIQKVNTINRTDPASRHGAARGGATPGGTESELEV